MDVWTLGEKYKTLLKENKAQDEEIVELKIKVKHIEDYLKGLTEGNKAKNETVRNKQTKSSGVRTRRQVTAKS